MLNVDGCCKVELEQARNPWPKGEQVAKLLPDEGDDSHGNLCAQADRLKEERDPDAHANYAAGKVAPILGAMKVTAEAVHKVHRDLRQSDYNVRANSGSQRANVVGDEIGIVGIDDKQRHDPQNEHSLQEIIVVVVVG